MIVPRTMMNRISTITALSLLILAAVGRYPTAHAQYDADGNGILNGVRGSIQRRLIVAQDQEQNRKLIGVKDRPWVLMLCRQNENWGLPSLPCLFNILITAPFTRLFKDDSLVYQVHCQDESSPYFEQECVCGGESSIRYEIDNFQFQENEPIPICPGRHLFETEIDITNQDFNMYCYGDRCILDGQGQTRFFTGEPNNARFTNLTFTGGKADLGGAFFLQLSGVPPKNRFAPEGRLSLNNCTFVGNEAATAGQDIYIENMGDGSGYYGGVFCEEGFNYDPDERVRFCTGGKDGSIAQVGSTTTGSDTDCLEKAIFSC